MEVKTRPISTQALFCGADLGCHVVGGWKSWNVWNERWCFFFVVALGFFLGNENYSLIETEGNKNLCVLTKLSTFKHPVFSSSAGGFYGCFGKTRARFYSVLKRVECCWVRSWLKKAKLKLPKIRRLFSWGKAAKKSWCLGRVLLGCTCPKLWLPHRLSWRPSLPFICLECFFSSSSKWVDRCCFCLADFNSTFLWLPRCHQTHLWDANRYWMISPKLFGLTICGWSLVGQRSFQSLGAFGQQFVHRDGQESERASCDGGQLGDTCFQQTLRCLSDDCQRTSYGNSTCL